MGNGMTPRNCPSGFLYGNVQIPSLISLSTEHKHGRETLKNEEAELESFFFPGVWGPV